MLKKRGSAPTCPQKPAGIRDPVGHGAKSRAIRQRAIVELLAEKTLGAAASRVGVNEKTLRRWLAEDKDFKRELAEAQRVASETGVLRVQGLMSKAADTFGELMGPKVPPNIRLTAARIVSELAIHQYEAGTILRRLEELEAYQRDRATEARIVG